MTERKETIATMWQDPHASRRGHQLMTRKLAETIPALYANDKVADYDTVLVHAKLFSPFSQWTWYVTEMDPATGTCFGLVEGLEKELGYFDLTELAETTVFGGVPAVERDLYWEPKILGQIKLESQGDSAHGEATGKGDAMTDESGTETSPSDAVNVEEFLFGSGAQDGEAGLAEVLNAGREFPTEDAADVTDDLAASDRQVVADGPCEEAAPAQAETWEELKVVLSIKEGRATIGVQQPSVDPHIESFAELDLLGLADEFPAVVARARARWEEEPRYPAYERPSPAARQRTRRRPGADQTATTEGAEETEQPQPEMPRLF